MSRPISSLPELRARLVVAPSAFAADDGEALARAFARAGPGGAEPLWIEIISRLLAIGVIEARDEETTLASTLGLGGRELIEAVTAFAPHPVALHAARMAGTPIRDDEEAMVRDLLFEHRADDSRETGWLAAMVARRAMRPNHLWQDLGLADRSWLNELLRRYFPSLHAGNTADMKWKKYFYRRLCEIEGFSLCTAPSCRECSDFDRCFGAEDGESLLAQRRRATELMSDI